MPSADSQTISQTLGQRREVRSRETSWAKHAAAFLAQLGVTPNQISSLSLAGGALSALGFWLALTQNNHWYLLIALVGIQFRLICNLMDGMVAVEHGQKSVVGELYNEVPDRLTDAMILLGAGFYSQHQFLGMDLAWANIFLATLTAYIRVFGASLNLGHHFLGPMAKQHRMFALNVGIILTILLAHDMLYYAQWVMFAGLIVTVVRRLNFTADQLRKSQD